MKKYLIAILFFLIPFIGFGQNCPSSAELIDACGTSFTTSNSGNDASCACDGNCCFPFSCLCSLNNDLDCNTNTGDGDGADVGYSVENDLYYKFCPKSTGTWDLTITGSNCNTSDGWQYAVFQGNKDSLHTLLSGGNNGLNIGGNPSSTGDTNITINVNQTTECYFIQIDGYGGTECDFDVTLTAPSGSCVLPVELMGFVAENKDGYNKLDWTTGSESNSGHFILERMHTRKGEWKPITKKEAAGTTPTGEDYCHKDYTYKEGTNYYRLVQVDHNGEKEKYGPIAIHNGNDSMEPIKIVNGMGQKVSKDYRGMKIYVYPDGTTEKKVELNQN